MKKPTLKQVTQLIFNWHQIDHPHAGRAVDYELAIVGQNGVIQIIESPAMGDGDKWRYTIIYDTGKELTVFNPNTVTRE